MDLFLELEIVFIVIGLFILSITAFVTTRDFVANNEIKDRDGNVVETIKTHSFRKGMMWVGGFIAIMITIHYNMTHARMMNVEDMFENGESIICENKLRRTVSRSQILNKDMGWKLENHLFKHIDYERDFFTGRCVEWIGSKPQMKEADKKAKKLEQDEKDALKQEVSK